MPDVSFNPAWFARNRHLQTMWGKLFRSTPRLPLRLERWPMADGDHVELHRLDGAAGCPRLLVLHGLEGGPRSHYVHGLLQRAHARGWGGDLLVFRSCGARLNDARRFYHSGETGDIAAVVERLVAEHPGSPLGLAGVSLGGNVLLKLLGERGDDLHPAVRAAVAVSVPYDLARGADSVNQGFARVYERHFLRSLMRKVTAKLERYPDLCDPARLPAVRTLRAFDDAVTAPVHGFASADDYYARSSSLPFLGAIRRPTLLLSAEDDPFLPPAVLDEVRAIAATTAALRLEFPPAGGHAGFVAGRLPWRPLYYAEHRVIEFLATELERPVRRGQREGQRPPSSGRVEARLCRAGPGGARAGGPVPHPR